MPGRVAALRTLAAVGGSRPSAKFPLVVAAALLLCLAHGPAAAGATAAPKVARVLDDYYSPGRLSVARSGTVKWVWAGSNLHPHNLRLAKAPKGVDVRRFRSPTRVRRFSFVRSFEIPGSYQFFCSVHPFTMRETITVRR